MFLLPGCSCCGCRPCEYCSSPCLKLTFSGFGYEGEACSECSTLDGQEIILRRPVAFGWVYPIATDVDGPDDGTAAGGSGATFQTIGIGTNGVTFNLARREDGSYYVTGIPLSSGGSGYDSPVLSFTSTGLIQCREPTVEVAVSGGAITAVTVVDGGEYWPINSCDYIGKVCATCFPLGQPAEIYASFSVGASSNSVTVFRRVYSNPSGYSDTTLVTATQSSIDDNGDRIPCESFVFEAENVTGCPTNGTITVEAVACDTPQTNYCDGTMPDQITLTLSGMGKFYSWSSRNGGSPGGFCPDPDNPGGFIPYEPFCGCDTYDITQRFVGTAAGPSGFSGALCQQDCEVVLDLSSDVCGSWTYIGFMPMPPSEGAIYGTNSFSCGGELSVPVSVSIVPASLETIVTLSAPTKGPSNATATAEVTTIGAGGAITAVAVMTGGSGYAAEITHHDEPTLTATITSGSGTGAELTVVLAVVGTNLRTRYWVVDSITVDSPGTGYVSGEYVVISAASGDTVVSAAYGVVSTQLSEPTITATPPATAGDTAALAVTVSPSFSMYGDRWGVASVAVTDGGSGYSEGGSISFSVAAGDTEEWEADAMLHVAKTAPTVTATGGSGSGVTFSVAVVPNGDYWRVDTVTKSGGGTGFVDGEYLTIAGSTGDVEVEAASARIRTVREEPVIDAAVVGSSGTGADLSVALIPIGDYWYFSSMSITAGGSGYAVGDEIVLVLNDATANGYEYGSASVASVDGSGAITSVSAYFSRSFFLDTGVIDTVQVMNFGNYYYTDGVIESVEVQSGGSYYRDDGVIESVTLYSGGEYYHLTPTGTVDADVPQVFFGSRIGVGAAATAVVDQDLESATFGEVTAINVTSGGSNYRDSGFGWLLSISSPVGHLQTLLGNEVQPPANPGVALDCANFWDKWQELAGRVSTQTCPSDLLSRSYAMQFTPGVSPHEQPSGSGLAAADYCLTTEFVSTFYGPAPVYSSRFFDFGSGPITIALAPA